MTDITDINDAVLDQTELEETIADVLTMFEGMAFEWHPTPSAPTWATTTSIGIEAPGTPRIFLGLDEAGARNIAASYFGSEDADDAELWIEGAKELVNVMGGAVKALLRHEDASLTLPSIVDWPTNGGVRAILAGQGGTIGLVVFEVDTSAE